MNVETLFSALSTLALVGWLGVVFFPRARWARDVLPVVIPAVLAAAYVALLAIALPHSEGGFSSLAGVSSLFANRHALLAGWTHYLAFDLLVGAWEVRDAQRRGIPHLLVVPALILTFLFGPVGWLLYVGIRALRRGPVPGVPVADAHGKLRARRRDI